MKTVTPTSKTVTPSVIPIQESTKKTIEVNKDDLTTLRKIFNIAKAGDPPADVKKLISELEKSL